MERMDLDGDGYYYSENPQRVLQGGIFAPSNLPEDPAPAAPSDPAAAPACAPTAAPISGLAQAAISAPATEKELDSVEMHALEESTPHQPEDLPLDPSPAPSPAPIATPAIAALTYLPASPPTSALTGPSPEPSAPSESTHPAQTVEKQHDDDFPRNSSQEESFSNLTHPPTTAQASFAASDNEVDPGFVDDARFNHAETDSAYDSDSFLTDTTSLNSEVTKYRIEHGRQYHGYKDGEYWVRT
jgi:hypothetical protein